jgi:transcription antitermination factor NusG
VPLSNDSKPPKQWVVVQLSSSGEREKNLINLTKSVHRILKVPLDVFIPATSQKARDDESTIFYMDGYLFVEYRPGIIYSRLNSTSNFEIVLQASRLGYHILTDKDINPLKEGVKNMTVSRLSVGDNVKVLKGTFKNLTGIVSLVHENGESVQINLRLSSKPVLIDYPASYLVKII